MASFPGKTGVLWRWEGGEIMRNRINEALVLKGLVERLPLGDAKCPFWMVKEL